jgi:tRNA threonylcarbamoyladenosine biosynthesis protein TsaB
MKVRFQTVYNEWPTMLVLALDTTTREGSLALARDGRVFDSWAGDASLTHAQRLPGDILDGLSRHGLTLAEIGLFAVAAGPGSFTGLRIGIATIQGLAFAHGRPVVGVSALDALAYTALDWRQAAGASKQVGRVPAAADSPVAPARIGAWMDARRQEVFACLYDWPDAAPARRLPASTGTAGSPVAPGGEAAAAGLGELRIAAGPEVGFPAAILAHPEWRRAANVTWLGDGALAYRELIERATGHGEVQVIEPLPPLAPALCTIAMRRAELGLATAPHAIRPVYIRRPDAELARDRRRAADSQDGGA